MVESPTDGFTVDDRRKRILDSVQVASTDLGVHHLEGVTRGSER